MTFNIVKEVEEWEKRHPANTYDRATGILFNAKNVPVMPKWLGGKHGSR